MLIALVALLGAALLGYGSVLARATLVRRARPSLEGAAIGFSTEFFDTLGIGCFAPTMAWFKLRRLVPDRLIPATMMSGHTLPAMLQGVIFLVILGVSVDPLLLAGCIVACAAGAYLGVPLVVRSQVWIVQSVVGVGLLVAAGFYALTNLGLMPGGGTATSLSLALTIAAIAGNFVFGVLLDFGIGNYAPTLAMLSLMGMDPRLCFPIMAGAAGMAGAGAATRYVLIGEIDFRLAAGIALGGIPAVLVAAFVVKSLPLVALRWLVIVVVTYAAFAILRAAVQSRRGDPVPATEPTLDPGA